MSKPKESEDVLSLLDSLGDTVGTTTPPASAPSIEDPTSTDNEKELLGFLDDLAKQSSRSQTPRPASTVAGGPRPSRDSSRSATKKSTEKAIENAPPETSVPPQQSQSPESGGGWLGGLWSMGSAAMKTAELKVKELQQTEEAKAFEERVRGNVSVLGKFSIPLDYSTKWIGTDLRSRTMPSLSSTLTTVLNTIAPPIEKHEGNLNINQT
jgi:Family of unknown function (DUF5427)